MVAKGNDRRKPRPVTKRRGFSNRGRRELDTPKGIAAEAVRLAIAFRAIQHEIGELVLAPRCEWLNDQGIENKLEEVETALQAIVGWMVMYEGMGFEAWRDAALVRYPGATTPKKEVARAKA